MTLLVSLIHAWQAANSGSIKRKSKDWMGTKHWAINPCLLQLPTHLLTAASTELPPGGKSLKSLKRLFNWRIFILSLTRRLWEWSAPVAPFISPWSPIEPTNIGQPPNCNEISLWGQFNRECYSLLHCVSVKRRWGPILFENSSDFSCSLCSVLKLRINFSTIDNFSIVELSLQQRNQKINVKWVKNIFHWIYVSSN